jgi:nitroreductase
LKGLVLTLRAIEVSLRNTEKSYNVFGENMEVQEALLNRRSIRKYTDRKISKENLDKILKAAMYSPSAMNLQAWQFIFIDDRQTLVETIKSIPYAEMLRQSAAAIIVCGDSLVEKNESWLLQNCSAAIQNILLSAHGLGIGSCWIAIHGMDDVYKNIKAQFKLPENIVPVSLISLGYPDEIVKAEERFKVEKIHYNNW